MRILAVVFAAQAVPLVVAYSQDDPLRSFEGSFAYSQSHSLDLSDDWDDMADGSSSDAHDNLCISSSLVYEGGNLLSSLAIIGGDIPQPPVVQGAEPVDSDHDDDDDDDDDDNDGSSSMLSNSSLKRLAGAMGPMGGYDDAIRSKGNGYAASSTIAHAPSVAKLLSLRGGATATATARTSAPTSSPKPLSSIKTSPVVRGLLTTALVTIVFEAMIGHILEFLKIKMQTASGDATYVSVLRDITSSKGIIGLWDGFCPWGLIQAVSKGAIFGFAYSLALGLLSPLSVRRILPKQVAYTLAGGFAGGMQGYVLSPTLLLKTRVMTNPIFREQMSLFETTAQSFKIGFDVVAQEGIVALMKGSNIFALKRVLDWSTRYYFAEMFERLIKRMKTDKKLTVGEKSIASLMGGFASTCFTLPLDVLVSKTQDAKKAGVRVNALVLFQEELKDVGWAGLQRNYMRGFEARLVHVCLTTLVIKTWTPIAYKILFPTRQ